MQVDLVTMLEKAISYVKFLQLQVKVIEDTNKTSKLQFSIYSCYKHECISALVLSLFQVLATDELWPVQGGKAPELKQVKDVIDSILASQRDATDSSSK